MRSDQVTVSAEISAIIVVTPALENVSSAASASTRTSTTCSRSRGRTLRKVKK